jgi:predicted nuclease of predicted toxin-antitoxin system
MTLKFLIDMNLPPSWVERLARDGWAAVHWSSVGNSRARDSVVMDYARSNGFVVFTHDLDLGTILATSKAGGPSVLQVRAQDVTPNHLGALVAAAIRDHSQALKQGALVTVDESAARVRVLPLV